MDHTVHTSLVNTRKHPSPHPQRRDGRMGRWGGGLGESDIQTSESGSEKKSCKPKVLNSMLGVHANVWCGVQVISLVVTRSPIIMHIPREWIYLVHGSRLHSSLRRGRVAKAVLKYVCLIQELFILNRATSIVVNIWNPWMTCECRAGFGQSVDIPSLNFT